MRVVNMTSVQKPVEFMFYSVGDRNVALDKAMVDKYSEIVCPVTEPFLLGMIRILGKDCQDDVLSYKIGLDMAQELREYE